MTSGTKRAPGLFTIGVKRSILGMRVINNQREDLGKIEDIIVDTRDNRIGYAILSFGGILGLGDKHFAIPWQAFTFDLTQKVDVLSIDKNRLSNAPGFDKNDWPDVADDTWGAEIHGHYGYTPYWEDEESPPLPSSRLP